MICPKYPNDSSQRRRMKDMAKDAVAVGNDVMREILKIIIKANRKIPNATTQMPGRPNWKPAQRVARLSSWRNWTSTWNLIWSCSQTRGKRTLHCRRNLSNRGKALRLKRAALIMTLIRIQLSWRARLRSSPGKHIWPKHSQKRRRPSALSTWVEGYPFWTSLLAKRTNSQTSFLFSAVSNNQEPFQSWHVSRRSRSSQSHYYLRAKCEPSAWSSPSTPFWRIRHLLWLLAQLWLGIHLSCGILRQKRTYFGASAG